jgi:uncharacterized membrane protein YkvA (DUF1232 family)
MAKYIDRMRSWIDTFSEDVEAVEKIVDNAKAARDARVLAATSLNYLVTRLDLIPDWEETCGVIDDAMVIRVAVSMAADKDLGSLDAATMSRVGRLCNEAEVVAEFLGPELYPRFKKYVQDSVGKEVRGRKAATVVDDAKQRAKLYTEIDEELRRLPPAPMTDPDAVERTILNYLKQKL